jgi:hypothetical protein
MNVRTVAPQEEISSGEGDSLVAVEGISTRPGRLYSPPPCVLPNSPDCPQVVLPAIFIVSGRETGYRIMALMPVSLRLEAADGSGCEDYRIQDGDIEVRSVRRCAEPSRSEYGWSENDWQRLTARQLATHVQGNTVVAQWLRHRIGWRRLLLACTDAQTRHTLGIAENVTDRFAA